MSSPRLQHLRRAIRLRRVKPAIGGIRTRSRDRSHLVERARTANRRAIETEERLATILEHLPAAVYLDRYQRSDGAFVEAVYSSPQMEQLTGYTVEAFARDPDLWLTLIHPDDRERVGVNVKNHLRSQPIEQEFRIVRADGAIIWVREEARVIESSGRDSILAHGFLVDVTERKSLEAKLARLAFLDPLTGLANRAVFADRLRAALARGRRSGRHPAVLFLDLDDFKTVNDSLGHTVGDRLLEIVAERLRAAIRPADCVARLGGDEFAVLLEELTAAEAVATADRLLKLLEAPIEIEGRSLIARGSIGIAVGGRTLGSPEDLLRDADAAMYHAKAAGRGTWAMFEPAMHAEALARFDEIQESRSAAPLL